MRELIRKILYETVGVPSGITTVGKNIYNKLMEYLRQNPYFAINGQEIRFYNEDGPNGRIFDFADVGPEYINIYINLREVDSDKLNRYVMIGLGLREHIKFNVDTLKVDIPPRNFISLNFNIAYPSNDTPKPESVIDLLKKDTETEKYDNGIDITSSIVHEIMHDYDSFKKKREGVKERTKYENAANTRFGIKVIDKFIYNTYFVTNIESTVRPSEIFSKFELMNVTQETFLEELRKTKTYEKLKEIESFTYDKFIERLKNEVDLDSPPKTDNMTEEEKVKLFLKRVYVAFHQSFVDLLPRFLGMETLASILDSDDIKEKKSNMYDKLSNEVISNADNPIDYFQKTIKRNSFFAQNAIKRISKIYSLLPSSKNQNNSINPNIALKEYDYFPEKRVKLGGVKIKRLNFKKDN